MSKLEAAVQLMDDPGLQPPPQDMLDIGERLRKVYARARARGYADLTRSELRKLPYAYWSNSAPVLTQVESDLVRQYWEIHLPAALKSNPRRAKRWLAPLFFIYCECFSQSNSEFLDFARRLVSAIQLADGLFAQRLQGLQKEFRFFIPADAPGRLAGHFFLSRTKPLDGLLHDLQLWPGFLASDFGSAVFRAGLGLSAENLRDVQTVHRLMDWSKRMSASLVKTGFRILYANALLSCWVGHKPADSLKNILIDYFLKQYGDPRFQAHLHYQWDGVSQQAKGVILNWLTGDTLRGFMKLLERTADDIWQYRQKFWMAYYERGYIDEAWMALGDDAWRLAPSVNVFQQGKGCARLEGARDPRQSVLLMRIGGLVFTEWSHNGSLRAYRDGSSDAPSLYQRSYHRENLTASTSLNFHYEDDRRPQLPHWHSDKGSWQRTARDFIRRQTNVHLSDSEIL